MANHSSQLPGHRHRAFSIVQVFNASHSRRQAQVRLSTKTFMLTQAFTQHLSRTVPITRKSLCMQTITTVNIVLCLCLILSKSSSICRAWRSVDFYGSKQIQILLRRRCSVASVVHEAPRSNSTRHFFHVCPTTGLALGRRLSE